MNVYEIVLKLVMTKNDILIMMCQTLTYDMYVTTIIFAIAKCEDTLQKRRFKHYDRN